MRSWVPPGFSPTPTVACLGGQRPIPKGGRLRSVRILLQVVRRAVSPVRLKRRRIFRSPLHPPQHNVQGWSAILGSRQGLCILRSALLQGQFILRGSDDCVLWSFLRCVFGRSLERVFVRCERKGCPRSAFYSRRSIDEGQSTINPRERFPEAIMPPQFPRGLPTVRSS